LIPPAVHLTQRQIQVLQLIARGLSYSQIAQGLEVSVRTVRHHAAGAAAAIGSPNIHSAIARAAYLGLIDLEFIFGEAPENEAITYLSSEAGSTARSRLP